MPRGVELAVLAAANLLALAAFCWPLLAAAFPEDAAAALPYAALAIAPLAVVAIVVSLDGSVSSAHTVALLGVLAAVGSAVRVASTGVGGVEAVFILLILAGRAFGARFGMLLGAATIAVSSALWGGIGPWTPFQIFACAWVGAGAGLLPRRVRGKAELWMLCGYGIVASYLFGLLTNLWFWPFAVGAGTGISYVPGAPLGTNLSSFLLYSLVTSTAGWDTLRAVTTIIGIAVVGRAVLAAFRRVKPVSSGGGQPRRPPRSTQATGPASTHTLKYCTQESGRRREPPRRRPLPFGKGAGHLDHRYCSPAQAGRSHAPNTASALIQVVACRFRPAQHCPAGRQTLALRLNQPHTAVATNRTRPMNASHSRPFTQSRGSTGQAR